MGPIFNIPERCLLAQAALYVDKGTVPIPDDIYIAAPEKFLMGSTDLVRVLRAKSITARASLSEAFRAEEPFSSIKDWQTSFPWPLIEDVEIDETLWTHEQADFANSRLVANSVWITHLYKVPSPDPDEVLTTWWDELKTKKIETAFLFTNITLATETLFSVFPQWAPQHFRIDTKNRGGRPPKYRWDEFFTEIIVRADLDGLPATQADLIRDMASWCLEHWGEQPADSVLKARTASIYKHHRKLNLADEKLNARR